MTGDRKVPGLDYSVIIPSRGRREMLLQALESVFSQSMPPSEVIVVLDGDVDGSAEAVQTLFPGVTLILHRESRGPACSRADGIRASTAEWVCLLDDDDIWHHRKQEAFARYLEVHPGCKAARSAFWQFSEDTEARELNGFQTEIFGPPVRSVLEAAAENSEPLNDFEYLRIEGRSLMEMLRKNCGVTSSTMVRREVLDLIPDVPEALRTAEDWLLFVFVATVTEWHLVSGRWFFYRVHGGQGTKDNRLPKWPDRIDAWGNAWRLAGLPNGLEIRAYEGEYAGEIHRWVWEALLEGKIREALSIFRAGLPFVVSPGLRASVLLPPPIRWRLRSHFA